MTRLDKRTYSWKEYLIFFLFAVLFLLFTARAFFAVDLTDETYYIASIHGILQGQVPFVTSWDTHIGWCLEVPFLALFHLFSPQWSGVYLYYRLVSTLISVVLVAVISHWLYKAYGRRSIFWFCFPCLFFLSSSVYALNYNRAANYLIIATSILFTTADPEKRCRLRYFAGGVLMGLACVSYPTWAVAAVLMVIWIFWQNRTHRPWEKIFWYAGGGIIVAAAFFAWVFSNGSLKDITTAIECTLSAPYLAKQDKASLHFILKTFPYYTLVYLAKPFTLLTCLYLAALIILAVKKPKNHLFYKGVCLLVYLIGNAIVQRNTYGDMPTGVWIAAVLFAAFTDLKGLWKRHNLLFITTLAFVLVYSFTSDNGSVIVAIEATGALIFLFTGLIVQDVLLPPPSHAFAADRSCPVRERHTARLRLCLPG